VLAFPWPRQVLGFALPSAAQWTMLPVIWAMLGGWLLATARSGRRPVCPEPVEHADGCARNPAVLLKGKRQQRPRM
jgi:hypothetical protein